MMARTPPVACLFDRRPELLILMDAAKPDPFPPVLGRVVEALAAA